MTATGLVCEAHGDATRITCVDCDAPICPRCLVRTEVGLKCQTCARPVDAQRAASGASSRSRRGWPLLAIAASGLVVLVLAFVMLRPSSPSVPEDADPVGTWTAGAPLTSSRGTATATTLADGRVLVVGGGVSAIPLGAAEVYDPTTDAWSDTGELDQPRRGHRAVLLDDGRVLVVGGISGGDLLASSEVYDPARGAWTSVGPMSVGRIGHTATLLPDGRVLVTGGTTTEDREGIGGGQNIRPTASAEVFDPDVGAWTATGATTLRRFEATATLLPSGRVLVAGGLGATEDGDVTDFVPLTGTELYDPAVGSFTEAASLSEGRSNHAATLLADGSLLVVGGIGGADGNVALRSAERYDPTRGTWDRTGSLAQARSGATATLLDDGRVLATGGEAVDRGRRRSLATAELFSLTDGWVPAGTMACPRSEHAAVLLADGTVLVIAGDAAFPGEPPVAQGCTDSYAVATTVAAD